MKEEFKKIESSIKSEMWAVTIIILVVIINLAYDSYKCDKTIQNDLKEIKQSIEQFNIEKETK